MDGGAGGVGTPDLLNAIQGLIIVNIGDDVDKICGSVWLQTKYAPFLAFSTPAPVDVNRDPLTVPLCFTRALRSKHQHFPAARFRVLENIKIFYEPPGACSTDAFAKVLL